MSDPSDLAAVPPLEPGEAAPLRRSAQDVVKRWLQAADAAAMLDAVDAIGADAVRFAADQSRRLAMPSGEPRAEALLGELRELVEGLHETPEQPGMLGLIARWRQAPVAARFEEVEPRLATILELLERERDAMLRDVVRLRSDRDRHASADARLADTIHLLRAIEQAAAGAARELGPSDPRKAGMLRGDVAERLTERLRDVLTQLVVTRQGMLSIDLLAEGHDVLVRAIERTRHTMVAALRTAVAARRALADSRNLSAQAAALEQASGAAQAGHGSKEAAQRALDDAVAQMRAALAAIREPAAGR